MRRLVSAIVVLAIAALTACSGSSLQRSLLPTAPQGTQPQMQTFAGGTLSQFELILMQAPRVRACPEARPGEMQCYLILGTTTMALRPDGAPACPETTPGCYGPKELQEAYGMTSAAKLKGKGQTVAVVDAFGYKGGYKALSHDLATYRAAFGLPACGSTCFKVVNQSGGTALPKPPPFSQSNWQGETALDIDMVSAMCPNCHIVLVETNDASTLVPTGVKTALKMANIVSNSFGGAEFAPSYTLYDSHPHKVITASAGDSGAGNPPPYAAPEAQPCGFAGVVCVGGTSLIVKSGKYVGEVVWDGLFKNLCGGGSPCATGSGCSKIVPKPSWQHDKGCTKRSASDISANADPYTGIAMVCTPCGGPYAPWVLGEGGTSEASPLIAAMYALAGNATTLANPSATIWNKGGTSAFHDVTSGINDKKGVTGLVCGTSIGYICKARVGYDGPTGWGSPNGLGAL